MTTSLDRQLGTKFSVPSPKSQRQLTSVPRQKRSSNFVELPRKVVFAPPMETVSTAFRRCSGIRAEAAGPNLLTPVTFTKTLMNEIDWWKRLGLEGPFQCIFLPFWLSFFQFIFLSIFLYICVFMTQTFSSAFQGSIYFDDFEQTFRQTNNYHNV